MTARNGKGSIQRTNQSSDQKMKRIWKSTFLNVTCTICGKIVKKKDAKQCINKWIGVCCKDDTK